ncbi:MAG: hypothetical protein M3277_07880, partial [Actinomycetota bacterium]|nr:hypothetical protein [Actinomycetota bacterium]
ALEILLIQPVISWQATVEHVAGRIPWFALWVPLSITNEVPSELVIRPSAAHLLYLTGLVIVVAVFALTRHRGPRVMALLIAGAVGVIVGAIGQLTPPGPAQRAALAALIEHPEEHQVCEERRGVTYCAYAAYAPWIDRWARPIEGALDRIPAEERPQGLVVRQTFGSYFEGPIDVPEKVIRKIERDHRRLVGKGPSVPTFWTQTHWGRAETEGEYEIGLALYVAMEAVGFPSTRHEMRLSDSEVALVRETMLAGLPQKLRARTERRLSRGRAYYCTSLGQARALAALWIAAQATPGTRAAVTRVADENQYGLDIYENEGKRFAYYVWPFIPLYPLAPPPMWDRVQFSDAEFHYASTLLQDPSDDVAAIFAQRWDDVVDPTTATTELLDDLGLTPHPTIAEQVAALPDDVKLEEGSFPRQGGAVISDSLPCF